MDCALWLRAIRVFTELDCLLSLALGEFILRFLFLFFLIICQISIVVSLCLLVLFILSWLLLYLHNEQSGRL